MRDERQGLERSERSSQAFDVAVAPGRGVHRRLHGALVPRGDIPATPRAERRVAPARARRGGGAPALRARVRRRRPLGRDGEGPRRRREQRRRRRDRRGPRRPAEREARRRIKHRRARLARSDARLAPRRRARARRSSPPRSRPKACARASNETRGLLLAPGSGALAELVAERSAPPRAARLRVGRHRNRACARRPTASSRTTTARCTWCSMQPAGQSLRGADARAFVDDANAVIDPDPRRAPEGHASASPAGTPSPPRPRRCSRAISSSPARSPWSSRRSVFALLFRRLRALAAVMPPLVLGTLWTAGLATALPGGLSAIAVAFTSVVVGVGVDTGVHVYAALLDARREGLGPRAAAKAARDRTAQERALGRGHGGRGVRRARPLGHQRRTPARPPLRVRRGADGDRHRARHAGDRRVAGARRRRRRATASRWADGVAWLTATRGRALVVAVAGARRRSRRSPWAAGPPLAEAFIAVRPSKLAPLAVQQEIFDAFGGKKGQWVVLVADPDAERARARADVLAEMLGADEGRRRGGRRAHRARAIARDAGGALRRARRARSCRRKADELEKRARRDRLRARRASRPRSSGMRHPSHDDRDARRSREGRGGDPRSRATSARTRATTSIAHLPAADRRSGAPTRASRRAIAAVDPRGDAHRLQPPRDDAARARSRHDMPRIGLVAGAPGDRSPWRCRCGARATWCSRRSSYVARSRPCCSSSASSTSRSTRTTRSSCPVLLGITVDEGMFLIHHARRAARPT